MKILWVAALGLCTLVAGPIACWAETPNPSPKAFTLQDCINTAMQNHVDLQVARNGVTSAKARLSSSRAAYFPIIELGLGYNAHGSTDGSSDANTDSTGAFAATYNILDGGVREAKVRGAKANAEAACQSLSRVTQSVVYQITQNYFEVLRQRHLLEVANQEVGFAQSQRDLIQGRIESGDAANADIYPVEAQLANAQVSQIAAQNRWRLANIELQRSMGLDPVADFTVADVSEVPKTEDLNEDALLREAYTNRPDLKQAQANVQASKAGVSLANTDIYPQIIANAQASQGFMGTNAQHEWTAFAGVAFNVFDGGAARANLKDSKATLGSSEARAIQLRKDVAAEVREAVMNMNNAQQRMVATQASLAAAQKNYEVQEEKYRQELAITLDLLNAQVAVSTAQTDAVEALYDYYVSQAQLKYAVGK